MLEKNLFISSLFGGSAAGLVVDIVLFPLDTIKTRLQAQQGFAKAGGLKNIYKGIGPQVVGSAPQAALFFCTYEAFKHHASPYASSHTLPLVHSIGGSLGETVACLIRVPMEIVKQRRQISKNKTSTSILIDAYKNEGFIKGLYRGFGSTVVREVPFAFIQLPILEYLKQLYKIHIKNNNNITSLEVAYCGAIAGGLSAAITTPLDVVKTRIMLADKELAATGTLTITNMTKMVYREKGVTGLFAGFTPRVTWITLGGCIFFGMYDLAKNFCNDYLLNDNYS